MCEGRDLGVPAVLAVASAVVLLGVTVTVTVFGVHLSDPPPDRELSVSCALPVCLAAPSVLDGAEVIALPPEPEPEPEPEPDPDPDPDELFREDGRVDVISNVSVEVVVCSLPPEV